MLKHTFTSNDYLLIAVNLVPLYFVWFEGWDASIMFLVYCLETILIGFFNVIKMAAVWYFTDSRDDWEINGTKTKSAGLFFILFFILHYGIFVFVQTSIFFDLSGISQGNSYLNTIKNIPTILGHEGQLMLLIFVAYYLLQTVSGFFANGEYKKTTMSKLLFQPYGRIFIQQFVVIIGSIFLGAGAGKVFMLIFVFIKIFFEIFINFDSYLNKAELNKAKEMKNG